MVTVLCESSLTQNRHLLANTDGEYFSRAVRILLKGSENSPR